MSLLTCSHHSLLLPPSCVTLLNVSYCGLIVQLVFWKQKTLGGHSRKASRDFQQGPGVGPRSLGRRPSARASPAALPYTSGLNLPPTACSPTHARPAGALPRPGVQGEPLLTPPCSTPLVSGPLTHTHVPCGSRTLPPTLLRAACCPLHPRAPDGASPTPRVFEPATLYSTNNSGVQRLWLDLPCGFGFLTGARLSPQARPHPGLHDRARRSTSEGLKSRSTCGRGGSRLEINTGTITGSRGHWEPGQRAAP